MRLIDLLKNVPHRLSRGTLDLTCEGVSFDSRQVVPGHVFVAIRGTQVDGHTFIDKAVKKGAIAVVAEVLPEDAAHEVTLVKVPDTAEALGLMAAAWYGYPSDQIELVGITGTNGKTTTTTLLYELFMELGYKTGLLSTIENRIGQAVVPATHTTPDPMAIQRLLAEMVESGCSYAFMEVSSHAAHQKRIAGIRFRGGVFTNISHDHLDYHGTFKAYIEAKKMFFDSLPPEAFALVNADDRRAGVMVQNTQAKVYRMGIRQMADFKAKVVENSLQGLQMELDGREFHSVLLGTFNAYNLLTAYAVAVLLGHDPQEVLQALSKQKAPAGRFERVADPVFGKTGIVDYAHTPDALENVLDTILGIRQKGEQLIVVVGCGGDRDKGKRPIMAKIAATLSDQVILTADNPRGEDPLAILSDMEEGIPAFARSRTLTIADRRQAIRTAVKLAGPEDIVLVAGKGHEKYQEIKGVKQPFDDLAELKRAFENQE